MSRNLTLLTDFYELTMMQGYFKSKAKEHVIFDVFYRVNPSGSSYAITAGLEQVIDYIKNLSFSYDDIDYLRNLNMFDEDFLDYLASYHFSGDIYAIPEGTPIFPNEPILTVRGPIIQAQFIETMILLSINHQSLIATKSNRIVRAANGRPVLELGARRAQGADGAILGARAAYIGGCKGTACTISDRDFNVPALGTMAHSWVQTFDSEYEAFKKYAELYPENCTLLVDTYNTLKSGVPNAIKVFKEILIPKGYKPGAIRIDSGDAAYLSKKARKLLDEAGLHETKIVISNSLDEYIIKDLLIQNAPIDSFGVGERLITSKTEPVFGGVYKIVAVEKEGQMIPKIKISNNIEKITNPGSKQVYRLYDRDTKKAIADVITLAHEKIDDTKPYTIFDPEHTWKRKEITNFIARPLLAPIFLNGEFVYPSPTLEEIVTYSKEQIEMLWEEVLRFEKPHRYYVDLSKELWTLKTELLEKYSK